MIMNNKIVSVLFALLLALPLYAKIVDSAVATVNGKAIMSSDYDKMKDEVIAKYTENNPLAMRVKDNVTGVEEEVLNQMIASELLEQAAKTENIKVKNSELDEGINEIKKRLSVSADGKEIKDARQIDKNFNAELKKEGISYKQFENRLKSQIAVRKLVDSVVKVRIKQPTKAQAEQLYSDIRTILKGDKKDVAALPRARAEIAAPLAAKLNQLTSEQVKISPIFIKYELVKAREGQPLSSLQKKENDGEKRKKLKRAKDIKKDIEKSIESNDLVFVEAIEKYSDDKSVLATGGEAVLIRGIMPEDFEKKVFGLDVGKISDPIETEEGVYIVRVNEKTAKKDFTYQQIEGELMQILAAVEMKSIVNDYLKELQSKADIRVMKKFEYSAPKPLAQSK